MVRCIHHSWKEAVFFKDIKVRGAKILVPYKPWFHQQTLMASFDGLKFVDIVIDLEFLFLLPEVIGKLYFPSSQPIYRLPKTEFMYKKLCIYPYMFKLQSPSKYSPFDAIHLLRCFFPLLRTVFELIHFDAF